MSFLKTSYPVKTDNVLIVTAGVLLIARAFLEGRNSVLRNCLGFTLSLIVKKYVCYCANDIFQNCFLMLCTSDITIIKNSQ